MKRLVCNNTQNLTGGLDRLPCVKAVIFGSLLALSVCSCATTDGSKPDPIKEAINKAVSDSIVDISTHVTKKADEFIDGAGQGSHKADSQAAGTQAPGKDAENTTPTTSSGSAPSSTPTSQSPAKPATLANQQVGVPIQSAPRKEPKLPVSQPQSVHGQAQPKQVNPAQPNGSQPVPQPNGLVTAHPQKHDDSHAKPKPGTTDPRTGLPIIAQH
jgi:hypothetical protein